MAAWARRRLSFANVISLIALFVALGGTGYAALTLPKNSVGAKQLKRAAVTPKKVHKKTVRLFRGQRGPQGIQGVQGVQGAPGEPNPNAANSELLDGLDSTEFVGGRGQVLDRRFTTSALADDDSGPVLDLPTFGRVGYVCAGSGIQFDYRNTSGGRVLSWRVNGRIPGGGVDDDDPTFSGSDPGTIVAAAPVPPVETLHTTWMLIPQDDPDASARIEVFGARRGGSVCTIVAHALVIDP